MFRKPQGGLIGVDIGSTSIKMVSLSKASSGFQVEKFAIKPLPKGVVVGGRVEKPGDLVKYLTELLEGESPDNAISFSIPSAGVSINLERVENTLTETEIDQHLSAQVSKFIALPISEVAMDYVATEVVDGLKTFKDLLVVAAKSEPVTLKAEYFVEAGFKPKVATVDTIAIEKILPYISTKVEKTFALFDMGFSRTSLYIVDKGEVVYSRENDFGASRLIEIIKQLNGADNEEAAHLIETKLGVDPDFTESVLEPFFMNVSQAFNQMLQLCFNSTNIASVDSLVLMGGGIGMDGISKFLEEELGYPVRMADPFKSIAVSNKVNLDQLEKNKSMLVMALGLALCEVGSCINLLPWREEMKQLRKKNYVIGAMIAAGIGAVISYGGYQLVNKNLSAHELSNAEVVAEIAKVDEQLLELSKVNELREGMFDRMSLIQGLQTQRPIIVALVNTVLHATPDQAYLTKLSRTGISFKLEGYASGVEVVSEYMRKLKDSGYFTNINMANFDTYANDKSKLGKGSGLFEITAEISEKAQTGMIRDVDQGVEANLGSTEQDGQGHSEGDESLAGQDVVVGQASPEEQAQVQQQAQQLAESVVSQPGPRDYVEPPSNAKPVNTGAN